jgi:hypothetical protein
VLAEHRPGPREGSGSLRAPLYNTVPAGVVPVLATAELYDPATNRWSATGPLRVARFGDAAVTLADGRVVVVPDAFPPFDGWSRVWDWLGVKEHELALTLTEIYDPRTGRFGLAGELPPIDWSPVTTLGYEVGDSADVGAGSLVALEDGGALLVGRTTSWRDWEANAEGSYVRSLRFDPTTNQWTEIDRSFWADRGMDGSVDDAVMGRVLPGALAASLAGGRVLVAGGLRSLGDEKTNAVASTDAAVYDPATGTWTDLPPLPEPRAGGAAVTLDDGSVILVGGLVERPTRYENSENCSTEPTGNSSAIRFVPGP